MEEPDHASILQRFNTMLQKANQYADYKYENNTARQWRATVEIVAPDLTIVARLQGEWKSSKKKAEASAALQWIRKKAEFFAGAGVSVDANNLSHVSPPMPCTSAYGFDLKTSAGGAQMFRVQLGLKLLAEPEEMVEYAASKAKQAYFAALMEDE
jgi:hypothetical protein